MHFTEIEPEECCDLKLAIPSTDNIITNGLGKKLEALKANKNMLDAPVFPKAAVGIDSPKVSDREEVAKVAILAKLPKTKDTAEQALTSPTTLKTQPSPVEPITPSVDQFIAQRKGEVRPTSKKLSKGKAAGATEVTPGLSTQGLNAQSPNESGAEPHKKKKNMDGGETLVTKAKTKKSQDKKMEKENVDRKGKAKSKAPVNTNLPTVPEKPAVGGTKKKKQKKATPTKVKGIALTTKISSKRKEAEKSKETEKQPVKSTGPRTSAK
ncbi:hypothetical protein GCG54_00007670 [Colletotrichum gloeosporioides]|uniref:Uncharacterized protein n=1 Tax=Colletotrichum gloeosporioides TaxID=474922 RepID=A0A8H4FP13_COLGL|nr:uncharacterized protein GCG54_00007670 [Colletotrichum gloeosporioides]KAF3807934.1 hypothetical protein GCG54_00007670 [Colletotrichum gloeosporioides]